MKKLLSIYAHKKLKKNFKNLVNNNYTSSHINRVDAIYEGYQEV